MQSKTNFVAGFVIFLVIVAAGVAYSFSLPPGEDNGTTACRKVLEPDFRKDQVIYLFQHSNNETLKVVGPRYVNLLENYELASGSTKEKVRVLLDKEREILLVECETNQVNKS